MALSSVVTCSLQTRVYSMLESPPRYRKATGPYNESYLEKPSTHCWLCFL